ncbi:NAD(P)-dependent alcohol dehydrogenase [Nocardiopsis sp. HNM0947]|uniref:NAD(P)-dependent alcohol dehydrogenase n=2 Tax=Nocardiopsis coralli TaxID=2772213 RepID=A0ABR9P9B4_9ACTN|nr:NAD(P)-dependent alcohol dehydrogenase [Nocardiopsis coralli]
MRASVLRQAGEVRVEERPVPEPGPGQVLVRVGAVGTCGSDTHYYEHGRVGPFVVRAPLVLGHEAMGTVVACGPGVEDRVPGERVSLEPGVPDGVCEQCRLGRYNLCPRMRFMATPPVDGAFCEYVACDAHFAHPVPDVLSDEAAALLEPLSVGVWACRKARVGPGDRVLVTGAGPIGLVVAQTARAFGAAEVTVSDVSGPRLAAARRFGATHTVDAREGPLAGSGVRAHVLVECSGAAPAAADAVLAVEPAGRVVLVGMGGQEMTLPVSHVQNREIEVTGTFRYANTWPAAIGLAASGAVDLDALVTHRFGLAQVVEALTVGRRDPEALKAVVYPGR